jgi:hypothetical protein
MSLQPKHRNTISDTEELWLSPSFTTRACCTPLRFEIFSFAWR